MAQRVQPIPEGYTSITPYLIVEGADVALAWYRQQFGAEELFRMAGEDGRIGHAELRIGTAKLMLADAFPEMGAKAPGAFGGSPVSFLLYVDRVDEVVAQAVSAGAKLLRPVADQFYGDRTGTLVDPFGHQWTIATHVEDVDPAELHKRAAAAHS